MSQNFAWWTPYQFAGNSPIKFVDLDGLEIYLSPIFSTNPVLVAPRVVAPRITIPVPEIALPKAPYLSPTAPYTSPLIPDWNTQGDVQGEQAPSDISPEDMLYRQMQQDKNGTGRGFGENPVDGNQQYRIDPNLQQVPVVPKTDSETKGKENKEEYVSIWKAPQPGKKDKLMAPGAFNKENFPLNTFSDGKAYFAKEKKLAAEYAQHYGEGIIELRIPKKEYEAKLKQHEVSYQGSTQIELPIPQEKFEVLNKATKIHHEYE